MENFQNDCCRSWSKNPFNNSYWSGDVDRQQVRSIDRNLFFFKLKLLIFRRWWQLWMRATMIKQWYGMNLFFVVFRLFVLLPNLMCKLIHNRCKLLHVSLLLKLRLHACIQTNSLFQSLFCVSPLKIILKQLFASGSVNIGETKSRWMFTFVNRAWGE